MKTELHDYDIYPKVFAAGKKIKITVQPLGVHAAFENRKYKLYICPLDEGTPWDYTHTSGFDSFDIAPDADGCMRFEYEFHGEQEHFIRIMEDERERKVQLSVYSLESDLCGRYPFVGDLHMHTCRSDGKQAPAVVAANYRKHGYDFLAITDHQRYYPSLEAIKAYADVPIEYTLVPGEEVHMPKGDKDHINDVHIVNFGGTYSINALSKTRDHIVEVGDAKELRSIAPDCPEPMSDKELYAAVDEYAKTLEIPAGVERYAYACSQWVFEQINKAGGLSIFAHPCWISNVYQVPRSLTDALFANKKFGAFEVLGGENYFEQNGFQTIYYYEQCAKGNKVPVVGSTDSHSSINNRNGFICSTIVFAPENTRESLIDSIKNSYSVAVDTISAEYRMVGELRLVKYADFLYNNFFPLHDELCFEEGRLMKEYACGDADAKRVLCAISGRMKKQREKYFSF